MWWLCFFTIALYSVVCVAAEEDLLWWNNANIYQVYPRSFKDSDGDGVGDLKGIMQNADYFKELGVDAIWLSPIFQSPMLDFGYDISDFRVIDPVFGTIEDFDNLMAKMNSIGVKLLLDFVPNHSSDKHVWFQKSVNGDPDYKDFYVWKDPKGWNNSVPIPPNNWMSLFGGSAWEWVESRKQFYFHFFYKQQPDLNFRNPAVVGNVTSDLEYWVNKGVDGFRMDAAKFLFENASTPDDPPKPGTAGDTYNNLIHEYDENQPETYELFDYWANFVYSKDLKDGKKRVLLLEAYTSVNNTMRYYGKGNASLECPFNFFLFDCESDCRTSTLKDLIALWMDNMPKGASANWVTSNHDHSRTASRFGSEMVDAINMFTMTLPGAKITYYGEEIGMEDTLIRPDQAVDTPYFARDPFRTPMQWDDSYSSGFSTNYTTWLPVNPNYWWLNVEAQRNAEISHLKVFQAMAEARKDPVLQKGSLDVSVPNNDTILIIRRYNGSSFVMIMNMGSETATYTAQTLFTANNLDTNMTVVVGSINSGYKSGAIMKQGAFTLRPKAALALRSFKSSSSSSTTLPLSTLVILCLTVSRFLVG